MGVSIRYIQNEDREFWFRLDKHLPEREFERKVRDKTGYVLLENDHPVGLLRYHLFWDNTPFCAMLFVEREMRGKGYGKSLMLHWEADMRTQGYEWLLTSTQADETAQHFYRKIGYRDAGGLLLNVPGYEQPTELFFVKIIK